MVIKYLHKINCTANSIDLSEAKEREIVFDNCVFIPIEPEINPFDNYAGKKIILQDCNLTNCCIAWPREFTVITSLVEVRKHYCTHVHPERIAMGQSVCTRNCDHVFNTVDSVLIDGKSIPVDIKEYKNRRRTRLENWEFKEFVELEGRK